MTQPFFSSRKWIKVWINEWRDGTLRWQATDSQRAFWIDLLALAGKSRYPGIVCAGKDSEATIGYPATYLSPNSAITRDNIEETLNLFREKEMISYTTSKSSQGETLYAVAICNWGKYQSDYEANKKYQQTYRQRKKARSSSLNGLTSQLDARNALDLEVEKEEEEEEERSLTLAQEAPSVPRTRVIFGSPEFKRFWELYPIKTGRKAALAQWCKQMLDECALKVFDSLARWKACERWQDPQFIPYAEKWLNDQWKSEPVKGVPKHEQKRQATRAAADRVRNQLG